MDHVRRAFSDAVKIARARFNGVNQKHVGTKQAQTAEILDGRTASRHDVDTPLAMSLREWSGAILYLLLIPLVWLARPQKGGAGGDAAAGAH